MINYSPLGDSQTGYMDVLRTIDEMGHSYSIDMEILTDYLTALRAAPLNPCFALITHHLKNHG